jgi:creatinine amidohydrolase
MGSKLKIIDVNGSDFESMEKAIALLPVGSIERHGDHLPLGTDGIIPEYIVDKAAAILKCLVLPPVWYGSCKAMRPFPGTFDVDADNLSKYLRSIMTEAQRNGVKILCVVNGHGGNSTPIAMAARDVSSRSELAIIVIDWWRDLASDASKLFSSPGHAGEDETSAMLAISPEIVKMELAKAHEAAYPRFRIYSHKADSKIYSIALTGDARKATKEKGEALMNAVVQDLVKVVNEAQTILLTSHGVP